MAGTYGAMALSTVRSSRKPMDICMSIDPSSPSTAPWAHPLCRACALSDECESLASGPEAQPRASAAQDTSELGCLTSHTS